MLAKMSDYLGLFRSIIDKVLMMLREKKKVKIYQYNIYMPVPI